MSKFPPHAILLGIVAATLCVVTVETPLALLVLGTLPLLAVLARADGRYIFARRLFLTTPLALVAVVLRSRDHAGARHLLLPALRVASAVAWSSWLSVLLEPRALRAALRGLGAPPALLELIANTRRFASQLALTSSEAWNAAALRGGLLSLRATSRTVGHVAGVIVVRALDRAESVAIAGALRGAHFADDARLEPVPSWVDVEAPK